MLSTSQVVNRLRPNPASRYSPRAESTVSLPAEVIREIIENAAYQHRTYAATLCLVSRTFYAWVCPILYRVLRVDAAKIDPWVLGGPRGGSTSRIGATFFKPASKPPLTAQAKLKQHGLDGAKLSKFGPFVKAILIQNQTTHIAVQILQSCLYVRDLSLWLMYGDAHELRTALNSLSHLERLSLDPVRLLGTVHHPPHFELNQPFFRQLTHLELIDTGSPGFAQWNATRDLGPDRMPRLTHLALHIIKKESLLPSIVQECPQIRVIVVLGASIAPEAARRTPKVVFLEKSLPGIDLLSGWERCALLGGGFWDRADLALETNTYGSPPTQCMEPLEPPSP